MCLNLTKGHPGRQALCGVCVEELWMTWLLSWGCGCLLPLVGAINTGVEARWATGDVFCTLHHRCAHGWRAPVCALSLLPQQCATRRGGSWRWLRKRRCAMSWVFRCAWLFDGSLGIPVLVVVRISATTCFSLGSRPPARCCCGWLTRPFTADCGYSAGPVVLSERLAYLNHVLRGMVWCG